MAVEPENQISASRILALRYGPMTATHTAHKKLIAEWVAKGLKKEGKTQVGLASAMGITQPQIYRLLQGERSLRVEEVRVVEHYLDEPFPFGQISERGGNRLLDVNGMAGQMPVRHRVQAGVWMEVDGALDENIGTIPFARDPSYAPTREQYAVQVVGDSMDRVLPDGCYAIVVAADGQTPIHGDLVIVKRTHRGLLERTIKRYVVGAAGPELRPESNDPKYKPMPIVGDADTLIEIEGFVIGQFKRLGR